MTREDAQLILPDGSPRWSHSTRVDWQPCKPPDIPPTYISASGSMYWEGEDGVVRCSNHWGAVSTCYWTIGGRELIVPDGMVCGFATWGDFIDLAAEREAELERIRQERIASGAVDVSGYAGYELGYIPVAVGQHIRIVREYLDRGRGGWYTTVREELSGVVERLTPHFLVVSGRRIARHTVKSAYLLD